MGVDETERFRYYKGVDDVRFQSDEHGEPIRLVSIEDFCATVRSLIDEIRASTPEDLAPDLAVAIIESLERGLRALDESQNQE